MLRIRLSRVGKRKQPSYRIVVADSRAPRDGAHLKIIGHYNPLTDPATLSVKEDEAVYWLQKGARPSETAAKLLTRIGVMEKAGLEPVIYKGPDVPPGKRGKKGAEEEAPAPAAATPAAEPAAAAEEPAAEPEAAAEEPTAEEPATEPESAAEEPTAEEPATEPATEPEAAAEEPAAEEPAAEEEAKEEPAQAEASSEEAEDKS